MDDIPDMDALVEAHARAYVAQVYDTSSYDELPDRNQIRIKANSRAILTAVLPLVVGPVEEALDEAVSRLAYFLSREPRNGRDWERAVQGDEFAGRARNTLSQLKALGTGDPSTGRAET